MYKDAEHFIPERFEGEAGKKLLDPTNYAFGFGRRYRITAHSPSIPALASLSTPSLRAYRSCAGQNFADAIIYIGIVSILATFDISKPRDESGREVEPEITFAAALIRYVPFCPCGLFCYDGNLILVLISTGKSILSSARLSLGRTQRLP